MWYNLKESPKDDPDVTISVSMYTTLPDSGQVNPGYFCNSHTPKAGAT